MKSLRMVMLLASSLGSAHALTLRTPEPSLKQTGKCNIFTSWNYGTPAALHIRLNVESWRRHSNQRCNEPILITDTNVKEYIPDMPDEYFEVYPAAKSDLVRYGALYHNGGIYMDTDVLVAKDMSSFVDAAENHDLASYMDQVWPHKGNGSSGCGQYSSNIMGARVGSPYMQEVWETQKKLLRRRCGEDANSVMAESVLCCYDKGLMTSAQYKSLGFRRCHVPWGGLNTWAHDDGVKNPDCNLQAAIDAWKKAGTVDPLDRQMYHLFNQLFPRQDYTCEMMFDANTPQGYLYTKSFKETKPVPSSEASDSFLGQHPDFKELGCRFVPAGHM